MTRKLGFIAVGLMAALVGCAASPNEGADAETRTESLGGTPITITDESTSADGVMRTELSANGERLAIELDGATLTLRAPDRTLSLRRDGASLAIVFDYGGGEHVVSSAPFVERSLDAEIADVRGKLTSSAVLRHGTLVPAAAYAIALWGPERSAAAATLLASFIDSLPRASATTLTPKMLAAPMSCDQGTTCSVRTSAGYSCSASCKQGWFTSNCASCTVSDDGHAYCSCDW